MAKGYVEYTNYGKYNSATEKFGQWSEYNSINYTGFMYDSYMNVNEQYDYVSYDEKCLVDGCLYLVVVDYDAGDSFGRAHNKKCIVGGYTESDANIIRDLIIEHDRKYQKDDSIGYRIGYENEVIHTYIWQGYFESLNSVEVVKVFLIDS